MRLPIYFLALAAAFSQDFQLKDGDTVVFYGDSITDQRMYTVLAETYAVTRYPDRKINFVHSGWGGDRVIVLAKPGETRPERTVGLARLEWDTEADAIEAQVAAVRAVDDAVVGATVDRDDARTRWLALDGTVAWVERRGSSVVVAIGVPAWAADAMAQDAWTATKAKR